MFSSLWCRSCQAVQGASGCVWLGSSCPLTRVLLCSTNVSPCSLLHGAAVMQRGLHRPGSGGSKLRSPLFSPFPLNDMHTQTHARTHAHLHWHRASLSACSNLLSPSLPLPPPPLSYYSVYAVTLTPDDNLKLPLFFLGLLFLVSPWGVLPACHSRWHGQFGVDVAAAPGRPGTWALSRTLSSGGGSYQVATPLPLSSWALPVGRTRSRTVGHLLSDGQP